MNFMANLPTRKVNGIGRVLERELAAVGIETCADIYPRRQYLSQLFGDKTYEFLIRCYLGLGRTTVQPAEEYERKRYLFTASPRPSTHQAKHGAASALSLPFVISAILSSCGKS